MKIFPALLAAALLAVPGAAQPIDSSTQGRIDRILKRTPLIDGHNDLPWALREEFGSSTGGLASGNQMRKPPLMTDMARMRSGRVGGQFWSVYIEGTTLGDEAIRHTIE